MSFGVWTRKVVSKIWRHRAVFAVLALFVLIVSLWIKWTPYNFFGDEAVNYHYNVDYILKHKELPISGRDDLKLLTGQCNESLFGQYSCPFSYQTFPPVNYVLTAIVAGFADAASSLKPYEGARIASMLFGVAFLLWLYGSLIRLNTSLKLAALITAGATLIPQVIMISSYANADIYSLAVTAGLTFVLIGLLQQFSICRAIWLGVMFGLFLTAKYNYLVLLPIALGVCIAGWKRGLLTAAQTRITALCAGVGGLVIGGTWYIRNIILYDDPIGVAYNLRLMAQHHSLGTAYGINKDSMIFLLQNGYFNDLLLSFFAHFSPEKWPLSGATYEFLLLALLVGGIYFAVELWLYGSKQEKRLFAMLLILGVVALFLVIWNTVQYTYQAQGRYLFSMLVPTALVVGYTASRNPRLIKYPLAWLALVVVLLTQANSYFVKNFLDEGVTETLKNPGSLQDPPREMDWRLR